MLFSALIGTGYHISFVSLLVIIVAILGELYTERGSMVSTSIFVYAATGPINGYFGGSLYARMGGKIWIKQVTSSRPRFLSDRPRSQTLPLPFLVRFLCHRDRISFHSRPR